MKDKHIKKNAVQCLLCGEIIESKHRHDFKWCACGKVAVDGGKAYLKRSYHPGCSYLELSEYEEQEEECTQ